MKKLLLTSLVVLSVAIGFAQTQKAKAPATTGTTPTPPVKTPPTAPPKPVPRKIKPKFPSMGIEKEFDTRHPIKVDTTRKH